MANIDKVMTRGDGQVLHINIIRPERHRHDPLIGIPAFAERRAP